jgi:hypothetical protein
MKTASIVILFAVGLTAWTAEARAEDVGGAARAFSQAQEAMLGGDAARAADLYELADELAPSAPALRNAARARLAAGHLAMAATNAAALLRRYPSDKDSREIAEAILARLSPQLAQLNVTCSLACTVLVDGKVITSQSREQHAVFLQPGARTVTASFDGERKSSKQITATAGQATDVRLDAPPRPVASKAATSNPANAPAVTRRSEPVKSSKGGLSRWWTLGGGVVTVGLGTATALSGMATLSSRDDIRAAVTAGDEARAMTLYDTGREQQSRTNILLGATVAAGVGTIILSVFTNWSGERKEANVALVPSSTGGMSVVYGGSF